jgi:hypothetical protein
MQRRPDFTWFMTAPYDWELYRLQDEARVSVMDAQRRFESEVREVVMMLEHLLHYYDDCSDAREAKITEEMNELYRKMIGFLKTRMTEDVLYQFVDASDKTKTMDNLIRRYGRKGLPRTIDDPVYQHLHPKTRKEWGIRSQEDAYSNF